MQLYKSLVFEDYDMFSGCFDDVHYYLDKQIQVRGSLVFEDYVFLGVFLFTIGLDK